VKVPHAFHVRYSNCKNPGGPVLGGRVHPIAFLEPGDQLGKMFLESLLQVNELFTGNVVSGDLVDIFHFKSQSQFDVVVGLMLLNFYGKRHIGIGKSAQIQVSVMTV
jgi:hypothetical protein